jgi:hypothetical protein
MLDTNQPTALKSYCRSKKNSPEGRLDKLRNKRMVITGGVLAMALTILFFSLFFNRFSGLRSGAGEYVGGFALVHGSVPFRDYFVTSPPLNQFKSGILLSLFGEKLIVSRTAGVIERSLIALLLYFWLLRFCRPAQAAIAAFATLVISTTDLADSIASYNHDSLFFAMISGYLAGFVFNRNRSTRSVIWIGVAAGIAAGLSLLTKQTIGLGATVAVPLVVAAIVWRMQTFRRAVTWLIAFIVGAAMPVGALLIWLAKLGVLKTFLVAIFIRGPAAKSQHGGGDFLTRAIRLGLIAPRPMILAICAALIAVWLLVRSEASSEDRSQDRSEDRSQRRNLEQEDSRQRWEMPAATLFGIVAIALGAFLSYRHWGEVHKSWPLNTIFLTIVAVLVLLGLGTWQLLKGTMSERQAQVYLMAAVSFNIAFMLSLSFPMFAPMLLPGFGLVFAGAIASSRRFGRLVVYAIVLLVCVDSVRFKLDYPFGFGFFADGPVPTATVRSNQTQLNGILLPEETVNLVDGVAHIVASNTTPTDTIFTYPEMALFYALTDRRWPTETASHNVDVVNDEMAKKEAARLLANPPKVIIYMPETEEQALTEESVWRNGHRMGQRDIIAAIETLAKDYRLAAVYPTSSSNQDIHVYVRPDSPAVAGK